MEIVNMTNPSFLVVFKHYKLWCVLSMKQQMFVDLQNTYKIRSNLFLSPIRWCKNVMCVYIHILRKHIKSTQVVYVISKIRQKIVHVFIRVYTEAGFELSYFICLFALKIKKTLVGIVRIRANNLSNVCKFKNALHKSNIGL